MELRVTAENEGRKLISFIMKRDKKWSNRLGRKEIKTEDYSLKEENYSMLADSTYRPSTTERVISWALQGNEQFLQETNHLITLNVWEMCPMNLL